MLGALCSLTACGKEDSGKTPSDSGKTEATPVPAVTKVRFRETGSAIVIGFDYSDENKNDIMYMDIDFYNSKTNEWERFAGRYPGSDYIA